VTSPGRDWNEANLAEDPAVELLQRLGYDYVAPEVLEAERESPKEVILTERLGAHLDEARCLDVRDGADDLLEVAVGEPGLSRFNAANCG